MVDRDADVKAAGAVELDDLFDRDRRLVLVDVREGAAVAERFELVGQAEEAANAQPVQTVALG